MSDKFILVKRGYKYVIGYKSLIVYNASKNNCICKKRYETKYISLLILDDKFAKKNTNKSGMKSPSILKLNLIAN